MKIETKFSNGDVVYAAKREYHTDSCGVIGPLTIGQVSVTITDSDGVLGAEVSNNYRKRKSHKEEYMCVETGIGSGTLYNGEYLFTSKEDAKNCANNINENTIRHCD